MKLIFVLIAPLVLVACTPMKLSQPSLADEYSRVMSLDKQHFLDAITVKDDQFEEVAVLDTRKGYIQNWPLGAGLTHDVFLRGFINKRTGERKYQVYVIINHHSESWLFPYQANYGRPLRSVMADKIHSEVKNCVRSTSCFFIEHATFYVEEKELLRMRTLSPEDIATKTWQFKLKTKKGQDVLNGFNANEILALLEFMETYSPVKMLN